MTYSDKVIIVEGKQDREKLKRIIDDDILIICTYGTLGLYELDEMIDQYSLFDKDVYIFTDADKPGEKLRKLINQEIDSATNLYIDKKYHQVEETPDYILASTLQAANINVKLHYLKGLENGD